LVSMKTGSARLVTGLIIGAAVIFFIQAIIRSSGHPQAYLGYPWNRSGWTYPYRAVAQACLAVSMEGVALWWILAIPRRPALWARAVICSLVSIAPVFFTLSCTDQPPYEELHALWFAFVFIVSLLVAIANAGGVIDGRRPAG